MAKKLSDMTLDELWQLFPIVLNEHRSCWKIWYKQEAKHIRKILQHNNPKRVSHIGSTAVEKICAKPIIDILVELPKEYDLYAIKMLLLSDGYLSMSESEKRISLNKGYTENGFSEKVYHLHLRYFGDNDELYFRDFIVENTDIAKEYENLKTFLWKKFEHNRDGYTESKTEFITKYTKLAKDKYGNKYG